MLKSPDIQKMISKILDSSDKYTELEIMRKEKEYNNDVFDEILITVGVCKRNEDGFVEFLL